MENLNKKWIKKRDLKKQGLVRNWKNKKQIGVNGKIYKKKKIYTKN